jgi:integral membrane protein
MKTNYLDSDLGRFRLIAILEGISFLVLLFIAMPLKYAAGQPMAVKYTGWVHGVLFMAFMLYLAKVYKQYNWSNIQVIKAIVASLLPFGTFVLERNLRKGSV